jgi:hypothetical protein
MARKVRSCRVVGSKIMARTQLVTCVGRVCSGFGFLIIIFVLGRIGSGYSVSSGENSGPRPIRHTIGSGRVRRVRQPMIRYTLT